MSQQHLSTYSPFPLLFSASPSQRGQHPQRYHFPIRSRCTDMQLLAGGLQEESLRASFIPGHSPLQMGSGCGLLPKVQAWLDHTTLCSPWSQLPAGPRSWNLEREKRAGWAQGCFSYLSPLWACWGSSVFYHPWLIDLFNHAFHQNSDMHSS